MPRTTVHCIVHRVTEEVVDIRDVVIYLPKTPEDLEAICRGFAGLARHRAFNKAGGAIDGCHVRIVICIHYSAGSFIRGASSTHTWAGPDGGYPCLQQPLPLITPYKRPIRGVAAQRFNGHHSRARSIIERAFGMMKTRFRAIFLQALEVNHTFVPHEDFEDIRSRLSCREAMIHEDKGKPSRYGISRLFVTIRAALLTRTWAGRGQCMTPGYSGTADCTGGQSTLLQGTLYGGYPCLQQPLPLITPYKRPIRGVAAQRFNGHPSRARSIIERAFGMMKTRFRAIFLQALEVNHTFVPHSLKEFVLQSSTVSTMAAGGDLKGCVRKMDSLLRTIRYPRDVHYDG
ncbi:hypothetical protein NHX12_022422 [Muraenolepis orangiensis]|uniref:DDE Tnp4 domain-containing protein n=1 Tax=Muraenolepis orangiensis TaxID=630683 RepID=A0A9Q0ITI0_9TELE|nr:hypothetical protein NHX12_022422 [Muraenolepis orangiensis]